MKKSGGIDTFLKKELFRKIIKFGMILAGSALVIGGLAFFLALLVQDIKIQKGERVWMINSLNAIAKLNSNKAKADDLILRMEKELPTAIEVPTKAIPELKNLAQQYNVKIDFQIGAFRQNDTPPSTDFSLRIDGQTGDLLNFLIAFERDKIVKIAGWDLTAVGDSRRQLNLSGALYIRPS